VLKGKWKGSLELSRLDSSALLLDMNLLTSELRIELERACQRAVAVGKNAQRQDNSGSLQQKAFGSTAG
jgi:hypothetical protein